MYGLNYIVDKLKMKTWLMKGIWLQQAEYDSVHLVKYWTPFYTRYTPELDFMSDIRLYVLDIRLYMYNITIKTMYYQIRYKTIY